MAKRLGPDGAVLVGNTDHQAKNTSFLRRVDGAAPVFAAVLDVTTGLVETLGEVDVRRYPGVPPGAWTILRRRAADAREQLERTGQPSAAGDGRGANRS